MMFVFFSAAGSEDDTSKLLVTGFHSQLKVAADVPRSSKYTGKQIYYDIFIHVMAFIQRLAM